MKEALKGNKTLVHTTGRARVSRIEYKFNVNPFQ